MKKVAVFGNTGGGKSTLSQRLADITGLPWVPLDRMKYKPGGGEVPHGDFKVAHDEILQQERWIIDGFGSLDTVWRRLDTADTLVYLDMAVLRHYWWVTKRLIKGATPAGWPEHSPLIKGALNSYNTVWLCHTKLTPKYREYVNKARTIKQVFHLRSPQAVTHFLRTVAAELENK